MILNLSKINTLLYYISRGIEFISFGKIDAYFLREKSFRFFLRIFSLINKIKFKGHSNRKSFYKKIGNISLDINNIIYDITEKKIHYINKEYAASISEKLINIINNVMGNNDIANFINEFHGMKTTILNFSVYKTYHLDEFEINKDCYANLWHIDNYQINLLKIFVLLEDIDSSKGPFTFCDGIHFKKINKLGFKNRLNISSSATIFLDENKIELTGKRGDIFVISTPFCYHKAGNPFVNCSREMLVITLVPACPVEITSSNLLDYLVPQKTSDQILHI